MKSVSIADLKANLSSYLNKVVQGEDIIVKNRKRPVAKIIPIDMNEYMYEEESALAAEGKLRLPAKAMDAQFWKSFRTLPRSKTGGKGSLGALLADRDEEG